MTGTSRLLTLTATAVIALGAAAGPSLAGQDRGKGHAYGKELVKQLKQSKRNDRVKPAKQFKQAKRAQQGQPAKQFKQAKRAQQGQPAKRAQQGKQGDRSKQRQQAGFVRPPKADVMPIFVKPPKHDRSPRAGVLPTLVKPPKHANRAPSHERNDRHERHQRPKHAVYTPPRPVVVPDYGHKRVETPRHDSHRHGSQKYRGHGGYAPPRHAVRPERHYHNHHQKVVVHRHYHHDTRHYHDHHDGSYLLPLFALGVTAAILASATDYGTEPAYPAYQEEVTFNTPRYPVTQPAVQTAPIETASAPSSCVMTREYQTQITVGGQYVPAYGQACLQPDGSWYHGPAVPEPY